MALTDKLIAIADAIRAKSGKSAPMTLDEMPVEIGTLSAEEQLKASEYPEYIHPEVLDIANKVASVRKDESIVFIAMSDSHYPANESGIYYGENTTKSALQANQAAKVLTYLLKPDFVAHLGDVGAGADSTTPDMLKSQIDGFLDYFREASSDIPLFLAIGNHDTNIYYHEAQTDGAVHTLSGQWLYENFTAHSVSSDTVIDGEEYGGYCYRDFDDKKLRVFLLNTSEKLVAVQKDQTTYGAQRVWFANALLNLNSKADASDWGFIVLCHYPADYAETMPLSKLFEAYVNGKSFTITDPVSSYYVGDGTSQTVNFADKNSAKFLAQFHGHIHNFLASRLHSNASGSPVQYNAWRVCVPNGEAMPDRHNYYGTYGDINFAEAQTYLKTADTVNGTSFVVNVINPSEELIYSFCYGAGYDRTIGYGSVVYYNISRMLANVTTNNTAASIEAGQSYSETITLDIGCDMTTITVSMGGIDISSEVITSVDGGYKITIPEVTGNIVIVAKAQARPNFTNLVPLSINADGTDFNVDGDGYDNGMYITSSGSLSALSGCTSTGFIPVSAGQKTIRIAGDGISADNEYTRVAFYDSNFAFIFGDPLKNMGSSVYHGIVTEEAETILTWTIDTTNMSNVRNAPYIRVCTRGDGANLIVTVNEKITYGGSTEDVTSYTIENNLTNVTTSNTTASIDANGNYNATLTANDGYELGTVTVVMGGVDVTSTVYNNGAINITNVTGNLVIIANATAKTSGYTNQIPLATSAWNGTEIYNGVGYKSGTRINSSNKESAVSGMCATGFISVENGDVVRFKNVTLTGSASPYILLYGNNGGYLTVVNTSELGSADSNGVYTWTVNHDTAVTAMRVSIGVIDETSIITVNEEII